MKQKFKNTKGITLVALIITIIVLLILAVVAITSISNSNIIKHAQNGKAAYEQGKTNEAETLSGYEQYLKDNNPNNNADSTKKERIFYMIQRGDFLTVLTFKSNNEVDCAYYDATGKLSGEDYGPETWTYTTSDDKYYITVNDDGTDIQEEAPISKLGEYNVLDFDWCGRKIY